MYKEKDILLFLNYCRIDNKKILDLIAKNQISNFINLNINSNLDSSILSEADINKIFNNLKTFEINKYKTKLDSYNIKYITILEKNYPTLLKEIYNPPSLLYYKGDITRLVNPLAIVGARKISTYGIKSLNYIFNDLSNKQISIVSGMALGVDRLAHELALKNNLLTCGVLASSLEIVYPKSNTDLYNSMDNHILISEYPLDTPPIKRNFVERNRIIAGLSLATFVVEAKERSGSLITARIAIESDRDLFALPGDIGNINSKGCNLLIKEGAKLVDSGMDIISQYPYIEECSYIGHMKRYELNELDKYILDLLKQGDKNLGQICENSSFDISDIYTSLIELEMNNYIKRVNGLYIKIR